MLGHFSSRPVTPADHAGVHALVAAYERDAYGRVESDVDRVSADLARPRLDPATDSLLVEDEDGTIAAWAWVDRRCEVVVHPAYRGRGLGAALLTWVEERARETGTTRLAQTVWDGDEAAVALLRSRGFTPMVTQWMLGIDLDEEPVVPAAPDGVRVRAFRPGDEQAAHTLTEDAFDEWQERRRSYDEWALLTVGRSTFMPDCSPVAVVGRGADERMVGAVLSLDLPDLGEGYVERVAVRRDQRGQGLARLLLRRAFLGFHVRGLPSATLWTHSGTGALALYERVGMDVRRASTVYAKDLTGP
ncbi:MAG: GNAT family N-acetyltransferase [Nocardioides sp.]